MSFRKEFDSAEHIALGNIELPGLSSQFTHFVLHNGVKVTFGEIIALAGDYFGVPNEPISLGTTSEERRKRFIRAYETLNKGDAPKVNTIISEMKNEKCVMHKMDKGPQKKIEENSFDKTLSAIINTNGNYVLLLLKNIDHFNEEALIAYRTGHELAMDFAVAASKLTDLNQKIKQLEFAYSIEAFACHFLTDRFASGHMRTPRNQLDQQFGNEIGALLTLCQHNEDGDKGLDVFVMDSKNRKKTWRAYGDGHLFEECNRKNREYALHAVQISVQEVFLAFQTAKATPINDSMVTPLIPNISPNNHRPLFMLGQDGKVLCRADLKEASVNGYHVLTSIKAYKILQKLSAKYFNSSIKQMLTDVLVLLTQDEATANNHFKLGQMSLFNPSQLKDKDEVIEAGCSPFKCLI